MPSPKHTESHGASGAPKFPPVVFDYETITWSGEEALVVAVDKDRHNEDDAPIAVAFMRVGAPGYFDKNRGRR